MMRSLFLALCAAAFAFGASAKELKPGDLPPDFLGQDQEGNPLTLSAMPKGAVVIVNFWASWCGPCRQELPILDAIQKRVEPDDLRIIAVNFKEDRRSFKKIMQALADSELTFASDFQGRVARAYDVSSIPHTFLVGRDGKIAKIWSGYSESSLEGVIADINALLATPRPAPADLAAD